MVILEKSEVYDPFDSVNELLNNLELENRAAKQMLKEPWTAQFPARRPSPIEEPRASSENHAAKQMLKEPRTSQFPVRRFTPVEIPRGSPDNFAVKQVLKEPRTARLYTRRPSSENRAANRMPKVPILLQKHRKSHSEKSICKQLREFRECYYKGSMRECNYRAVQLEEVQTRTCRSQPFLI
ncbi:hypothetical protein M3Y97_00448200 [Aphelenchoides bicaudatus]|nr:hypothetical protein M3Y97_00448200 [Aphelenchoides bicaudatus]